MLGRRLLDLLLLRTRAFKEVADDESFTRSAWIILTLGMPVSFVVGLLRESRTTPITGWLVLMSVFMLPATVLAWLAYVWVTQWIAQRAFHGCGGVLRLLRTQSLLQLFALIALSVIITLVWIAFAIGLSAGIAGTIVLGLLFALVMMWYGLVSARDALGVGTGEAMVALIAGGIASRVVALVLGLGIAIVVGVTFSLAQPLAEWRMALEAMVLYARWAG